MKARGSLPSTKMPTTVGVGVSLAVTIFSEARRSSVVRSFAASTSGATAAGRYSRSNRFRSRSVIAALGTGWTSKGRSRWRRRSLRMRSSWVVARPARSSSVTSMPASVPSSRTPTKTTPGLPCPGRSLAKAHTAWRTDFGAVPRNDPLRSTRSDSGDTRRASSSASVRRMTSPYPSWSVSAGLRFGVRGPRQVTGR